MSAIPIIQDTDTILIALETMPSDLNRYVIPIVSLVIISASRENGSREEKKSLGTTRVE